MLLKISVGRQLFSLAPQGVMLAALRACHMVSTSVNIDRETSNGKEMSV